MMSKKDMMMKEKDMMMNQSLSKTKGRVKRRVARAKKK